MNETAFYNGNYLSIFRPWENVRVITGVSYFERIKFHPR
jgi:hypothetical protein